MAISVDMEKPKIIAYLKPSCGWSQGVRAIMRKYDLPFEDRDIINDPVQRQEMIEKSGQMLSPCVEVNGRMLPDISGEEVEAFLLSNNLVQSSERAADAPTNQPCAHEMPQAAPLQFRKARYCRSGYTEKERTPIALHYYETLTISQEPLLQDLDVIRSISRSGAPNESV